MRCSVATCLCRAQPSTLQHNWPERIEEATCKSHEQTTLPEGRVPPTKTPFSTGTGDFLGAPHPLVMTDATHLIARALRGHD